MATLLVTTASKKTKYLGIKLTKEVRNVHSENVKPLKKEIDTRKNEKALHAHGLVKLPFHQKLLTDSRLSQSKSSSHFSQK